MEHHDIEYGQLVRNAFRGMLRGNNPFVLALGSLIFLVGSILTVGILLGPLAVGLARASLNAVRGEPVELDDLKAGFRNFVPSLVAGIIVVVAVVVGFFLLVVPGFIALFLFQYTAHVIAEDPDVSGIDAVKRSYALARANVGPSTVLLVIGAAVGGLLSPSGIGAVVAGAFIGVAIAEFYESLDEPEPEAPQAAAPQVEEPKAEEPPAAEEASSSPTNGESSQPQA